MRNLLIMLTALLGALAMANENELLLALDLQTREGEQVSGAFSLEAQGAFLHRQDGGTLYRWERIVPESLPVLVREAVRRRIFALAADADDHYRSGEIAAAARSYAYLYSLRSYLEPKDLQHPALAELEERRQGLVRHDGEWVPYADRQRAEGLVLVNGEWMKPEQARMYRAFAKAIQAAREAEDPEEGALLLSQVIAQHPDAAYVPVAERMRDRLLARGEAEEAPPWNGELVRSPPQPARPAGTSFTYESYSYGSRRNDPFYEPYRYWPGKIIISGERTIVVPPSPKHPRYYRSGGGLRMRIGD